MTDALRTFFQGTSPLQLVLAAAVVVAGWMLSRVAERGVVALTRRLQGITVDARHVIGRVTRYAVFLSGLAVASTFLGASIEPLLTIALVVAVVVALALRGISDNFAAGLVLQTRRPVTLGDQVEIAGHRGVVTELNGRSVILRTREGLTVHVPNATVLGEPLVNHTTAHAKRARLQLRMQVADQDRQEVKRRVVERTATVGGVLEQPPPQLLTTLDAPDRMTLDLRFWYEPLRGPVTRSAVLVALADDLRALGLSTTITAEHPDPPLTPPPAV